MQTLQDDLISYVQVFWVPMMGLFPSLESLSGLLVRQAISGLSFYQDWRLAILAGAFSMAGGEYVSVSTQKDTEEAAVAREQLLLDKDMESAKQSLYAASLQNGECETSAQLLTNKAFLKNPLKALVEEKYGIEYEEFTNPWHAAISSFIAFVLGSLPPMLSITVFPSDYRIPATVFIVALSLLITGYTSAKLGKAPTKTAMIRNLCIGLLTMGVTFLLGQLFSI